MLAFAGFPRITRVPLTVSLIICIGIACGDGTTDPDGSVTALSITPDSADVRVGQTLRLQARATLSNGETVAAEDVAWTSQDPAIASVTADGLVTALAGGKATISATAGNRSAQARIVALRPVAVLVAPDTARLAEGATLQLEAQVQFEGGIVRPATSVTWESLDPAVVTVGTNGVALARAPGLAIVVGSAEGVTGEGLIRVPGWFSAPPLPVPLRAGHAAAVDGKLFYIGGNSGGEDYEATNYVYDLRTRAWSAAAAMPTARDQGATAVIAGAIYVIGGVNPAAPNNGFSRLFANEAFSVAGGNWMNRAAMPTARAGARADTLDGKIYVVSGTTVVEHYDTVEVYDPATNGWSVAPSIPTIRSTFALGSIGGKLYAAGGELTDRSVTGSLEIFDPTANSWSWGTAMPTPRGVVASAVLDGRLVVLGGYAPASGILGAVEAYDPATDSWSALPSMPKARREARAAVLGGAIFVVGGVSNSGISSRVDGFIP